MHICYFIENIHPNPHYNLKVGGISNQILQLLPSYEKINDLEITIVTKYSEYKPKTNRVNVYIISKFKNYFLNSIYFIIKSFFKIIKIHKKKPIDIINIDTFDNILITPFILKKIFKIPILMKIPIDFSSYLLDTSKLKSYEIRAKLINFIWINLFKRIILKKIDFVRAINELIYKQVVQLNYCKNDIIKIPNGISFKYFKLIKKKKHEGTHFGYVGRLVKFKNLRNMLDVFKIYFNDYHKDKLFIYGEGSEKEYIKDFININNLAKNILLMGYEKEKVKIYSNLDVIVDPALAQGISNTNLEAMSTKTLVIASNVSGNRDLIKHGYTGLLFNPFDKNALLKNLYFYKRNINNILNIIKKAYNEIPLNYDVDVITSRIYNFLKKKLI